MRNLEEQVASWWNQGGMGEVPFVKAAVNHLEGVEIWVYSTNAEEVTFRIHILV